MFFLATHPPSYPCSAIEPPNNTAKAEGGALKPSLFGGGCNMDWEPWVHPPLSAHPRAKWVSRHQYGCARWHQGSPQTARFLHTQLVRWPVHFSSLCREMSLSCNPKEIQAHACGVWRNHWLPKESIKLYFSLSRVCERHLFPLPLTMGDERVFFHTLTALPPPPTSASICADVGQPHL